MLLLPFIYFIVFYVIILSRFHQFWVILCFSSSLKCLFSSYNFSSLLFTSFYFLSFILVFFPQFLVDILIITFSLYSFLQLPLVLVKILFDGLFALGCTCVWHVFSSLLLMNKSPVISISIVLYLYEYIY